MCGMNRRGKLPRPSIRSASGTASIGAVREDPPVRILAFDTATPATAVALATGDGPIARRRHDPEPGERPGHQSRLLALIAELLAEAGLGWADVERIAVGIGPGTFTGLRVGVATARALAQAHGAELVGVSTLHALAAQAAGLAGAPAAVGDADLAGGADPAGDGARPLVAVLDARRGEAFAAAWRDGRAARAADPAAGALLAPAALAPDALQAAVRELPGRPLAVGDGALRFRVQLEATGALVPADDSPAHRIDAAAHCRLAAEMEPPARDDVLPAYLRLPDAELALRRRTADTP
jgi:tRNA threonylcarbamoyladenosine biosynthesis protein TsaB